MTVNSGQVYGVRIYYPAGTYPVSSTVESAIKNKVGQSCGLFMI